jgi:hypothetical protein
MCACRRKARASSSTASREIAAFAKRDCPLSKALASVAEITLVATLDHGPDA